MRILITGATGFVGGHLIDHLAAEGGHRITGLSRSGAWPAALAHLRDVDLRAVELTDRPAVAAVVRDVRPDWLFHLAGYADTGKSFREPDRCWADNLTATRALYDAVAASDVRPRILFASTGLIYGDPDTPGAAHLETAPLKPASPYAASKAAADLLGYQVSRSPGLAVVRVRLFNQIGPRQADNYAVAKFARQIAAVEASRQAAVQTGDLSARRDLTDVRDMVAACRLLVEKGTPGEAYNAGRGQTWVIRDVLAGLVKLATVPIAVAETPDPTRQADTAVSRADTAKLAAATGWRPTIPLEQTLEDVLNWWRSQK